LPWPRHLLDRLCGQPHRRRPARFPRPQPPRSRRNQLAPPPHLRLNSRGLDLRPRLFDRADTIPSQGRDLCPRVRKRCAGHITSPILTRSHNLLLITALRFYPPAPSTTASSRAPPTLRLETRLDPTRLPPT